MSKRRPKAAAALCVRALERVDEATANHLAGRSDDLSIGTLENVKRDLERMLQALDKTKFSPSYSRFILDWPDEHGLIDFLLGVSQNYKRWT